MIYRHKPLFGLLSILTFVLFCPSIQAADRYSSHFQARFDPALGIATASIEISQSSSLVRVIDLAMSAARFSNFSGDGNTEYQQGRLIWTVPASGGKLQYQVKIDHRKGDAYDARMTESWAILRLDDLFPPARVRALKGVVSQSSLSLHGPTGWVFESRYGPVDKPLTISTQGRKFDRPTGWLAAGKLGIRRDLIRNRKVVLAGPPGQGMRRLETLAFLRWTMPRLLKVFDGFPERLLIVGARDDMWRGGLSGPSSLYLHTERPLISENATSAVLHELVHVATSSAHARDDWLVEGLAEYYSLEILRRSGGISQKRYDQTLQGLADWARKEKGRLRSPSSGAHTARAVLLLSNLQQELKLNEAGSLDDIVQQLVDSGDITGQRLLLLTEQALSAKSTLLRKALAQKADSHS
ncbi:MAG: hypothetical protein SH820_10665 [Xanthomonadales bacterium]|nr:hypothetical protein [Xanthomonadales bacterium]